MSSLVTSLSGASQTTAQRICDCWAVNHQERMSWAEIPGTLFPQSKSIELYIDSHNGTVVGMARAFADGFHAGYGWGKYPPRTLHGTTTTGAAVTVRVPAGIPFPGTR